MATIGDPSMDAEQNQLPSVTSYLPLILILLFVGFGGLFLLFNLTEPTLWPRWLFFFMVGLNRMYDLWGL